jgi:hypothetical protein
MIDIGRKMGKFIGYNSHHASFADISYSGGMTNAIKNRMC